MSRPLLLPRITPARREGRKKRPDSQQVVEFLELYLEVDQAGRRALRQLVRQSSGKGVRPGLLH